MAENALAAPTPQVVASVHQKPTIGPENRAVLFLRVERQASPGTFSRRTPAAFTGLRGELSGHACAFVGLKGWADILRMGAPVGSGLSGARWLHRAQSPLEASSASCPRSPSGGKTDRRAPEGWLPMCCLCSFPREMLPNGAMRVDSRNPAPCTGRGAARPLPCVRLQVQRANLQHLMDSTALEQVVSTGSEHAGLQAPTKNMAAAPHWAPARAADNRPGSVPLGTHRPANQKRARLADHGRKSCAQQSRGVPEGGIARLRCKSAS